MSRVPDQRQQIAKQIENSNKSLGRILSNNQKYISFGGESNIPNQENSGKVFTFRKTFFVKQRPGTYYTPSYKDFLYKMREGVPLSVSYINSNNGTLSQKKIAQYSNIKYDILVKRSTPTNLVVPIRCKQSVRIELNGEKHVVLDSGDVSPNNKTSFVLNLRGGTWNYITIYFYCSSSNEDDNFLDIEFPFLNNIEESKYADAPRITTISATQGSKRGLVNVSWDKNDLLTYSKYQIYYGTSSGSVSTLLATDIPNDQNSFLHNDVLDGVHYFYKVRGYNESGEFGDFSDVAEGWSAFTTQDAFLIEPQPNSAIGNTETAGYYGYETNATGLALVKVTCSRELGYVPELTALNPNGSTIHTGNLFSTLSTNSWKYSFVVSGIAYTEGRYTLNAVASSLSLTGTSYFTVDKTVPNFYFAIDGDGYFQNSEDPYARYGNVFLTLTGNTLDPTINSLDGYIADLYQFRFVNTVSGNLPSSEWYSYVNNTTPVVWTLEAPTGYKVVYGQLRDRAGNTSLVASDTIYYATGYISNVSAGTITTGYDKITINWTRIDRPDLDGYTIYRHVNNSATPLESEAPYYYVANPTITSFIDVSNSLGGTVYPVSGYHYWIKGYTKFGEISSGFTNFTLSGQLRTAPPNSDVLVDSGVIDNSIWVSFKNSSSDDSDSDRRGYWHYIWRKDISAYPAPNNVANSVLIGRIFHSGNSSSTFTVYDTPPNPTSYFQYFSNPENKFGYRSSNFTYNPVDTGIRLNDGPPSKPGWKNSSVYRNHYNIHLVWSGNTEPDIAGYNLFREEGTIGGSPTSTYYKQVPYKRSNEVTEVFYDDTRDQLLVPSSLYTYWLQAYDTAGFTSEYSNPLTTGLLNTPPPVPQWVSGECFAWYGYNHLVFSGYNDSYQLLAGYRVYRSTGTDASQAISIGTLADDRWQGYKNEYDDHDVDYFKEYFYWCTAYNKYGNESNKSAMLSGIGFVQPNYGELFANYLDNSSFERELVTDTNWYLPTPSNLKSDGGAFGGRYVRVGGSASTLLAYSGYIYIQPAKQYFISLYSRKNSVASANLRVTGTFYSVDRETAVGAYGFDIPFASITNSWLRFSGGPITAPSNATNATMQIFSTTAIDLYDVDAVQFEEYDATKSPRRYVDSRVMSADRMQAHFIKGDMLEFNSIKGNKLEANTISGREILAGSITADILKVPGIGNFVPNSSFEQCDTDTDSHWNIGTLPTGVGTQRVGFWYPYTGAAGEDPNYVLADANRSVTDVLYDAGGAAPLFGSYVFRFKPTAAPRRWSSALIPVVTGISYRLSTYYLVNNENPAATTNAILGVRAYGDDDGRIEGDGALGPNWTYDSTTRNYYQNIIGTSVRNTWLRTGYDLVITGASVKKIAVTFFTTAVSTDSDPFFYFDGVKLEHSTIDTDYNNDVYTQIDGWGIRTQSIVAGNIAANAITATKIAADSVVASHIQAGAITAGKIGAQTIDTQVLKLTSTGNELSITPSGLIIGTPGTNTTYSKFSKDRAEYVVNGNAFNYARRVEMMNELSANTYYSFDPPFRKVPNILLSFSRLPTIYTSFGANNQHIELLPLDITTTGFYLSCNIVSGFSGTAGGTATYTLTSTNLDKNIGTMYLGNSGVSVGDTITNFTSQNWISYNNISELYNWDNITINAKIVLNSQSSYISQRPDQWNIQFIWGLVNGSSLQVSGVLLHSGFVTYGEDILPLSYSKQASFRIPVPGSGYGFQIRAYQYNSSVDEGNPPSQTLFGSGHYLQAVITSGTSSSSYSISAIGKFTALIIE